MYCPNCNAYNDDNATRCTNCGNLLQKIETPRVDVPPPPPEARGGVFAPPAASGGAIPDLPNYLVQAVVLTVVSFMLAFFTGITGVGVITGLVAIVNAAQVNSKVAENNYAGARNSSRLAKIWCWGTLAILIIGALSHYY